MENEIFKQSVIDTGKLIPYGFILEDNKYTLSKNILDNTFRIDVEIQDQSIKTKIYDLLINEEYTGHLIKNQNGSFVSKVRQELENVLIDIKESCCTKQYFITGQANLIANMIIEKYGIKPEYLWKKYPTDGIFRHPKTKKWFALIMVINKNRLDDEDKEVEILNVKLDENKIQELLKKDGFYKAYHMNKKYWITIVLDNTISDEEIIKYIEESYQLISN